MWTVVLTCNATIGSRSRSLAVRCQNFTRHRLETLFSYRPFVIHRYWQPSGPEGSTRGRPCNAPSLEETVYWEGASSH